MCSIGEDDFGDDGGLHAMVADMKLSCDILQKTTCSKCGTSINTQSSGVANGGETESVVCKLSFREVECKDCFLAYVRHKFRATLGSSKILPRDAAVLVVFDGSAESLVLLDMLHHAQTQNTFKRLHCHAKVLHIDEALLLYPKATIDESNERILAVRDCLSKYEHFDSYIQPLEAKRSIHAPYSFINVVEYLERDLAAEQEFVQNVMAMKTLTSQQDYIRHYRNQIISAIANQLNCRFVFVPDISTALAAQLLTAVALGRGGSAGSDVALVDERLGENMRLVRPIKDLNEEEVNLYLKVQQLKPLKIEGFGDSQYSASSLQNLTNAFVKGLQSNFSATVSTIFRTGDKITNVQIPAEQNEKLLNIHKDDVSDESTTCGFCNSPLDFMESRTLLAIEFSRLVSQAGTNVSSTTNLDQMARRYLNGEYDGEIPRLCHACRNIRNDCDIKSWLLD